jgi:lysophospholipase L1-like esterase
MKTASKIFYSITITVLFFVIIESALRLANFSGRPDDTRFILNPEWDYPEFFLKDHDLFWRFRSNQVIRSNFFVDGVYHINNHGLRGPAFAAKKPAGTQRIICIGNSCTFGWHVGEDEPYARQLEWALNAGRADSTFEVINGGVTGYSSLQGLRFLREYVLDWEPDVLVISYGWNDHWAAAQGIPDKDQKLPPQWVLNVQNLLGRTYTYRCLKYLVFSIKSPPPADFSRTHPVYRVSPEDFRINMGAMIAEAAARNIDVYLLTLPIASRTGDEYAGLYEFHERYNQIIRSYADIEGVQVIDAADRFRDHSAFFDNPELDLKHYNALGHKVIATMLADAIMHRGSTN